MDDAFSPPAAAHGFDAAVVVSQSEVRLCAVVHKLPLRSEVKYVKLSFNILKEVQHLSVCLKHFYTLSITLTYD